jgi:ABC-type sulfate transport system permease subunit
MISAWIQNYIQTTAQAQVILHNSVITTLHVTLENLSRLLLPVMEAVGTSETSVSLHQTTWCNITVIFTLAAMGTWNLTFKNLLPF